MKWLPPRAAGSLFLGVALLQACAPPAGGSDAASPVDAASSALPRCVPGAAASCGCSDGRTGAQVCTADGVFGACACSGLPPDRNPPARCVPNMAVGCVCDDLRMGVQTCGADGSYGACRCPGSPSLDASVSPDASADASGAGDGGGCNPEGGIQCDGDWVGRCTPACTAAQCCSPQNGAFACVARDARGQCPAADLFIDADRVRTSATVQFRYFAPTNCALVERCVNGPGMRRLLRFDTRTPNQGTADMYLGAPSTTNPNFEYSTCHNHYHFNTYANYQLLATDGSVAARGHKQAFCLEDIDHANPMTGPAMARYTCGNQGISMGWADIYNSGLDCQWVDVTDVAPGSYVLRITVNEAHLLNESNYDNNVINVPVTISAPTPDELNTDPLRACAAPQMGLDRTCGWTLEGAHSCTPTARVTLGCSAACGLGTCTGDTMLRVYDGDRTAPGSLTPDLVALGQNDDSGCALPMGMTGNDLCSRVSFNCPASGRYTVLTAPYRSAERATCNLAVGP